MLKDSRNSGTIEVKFHFQAGHWTDTPNPRQSQEFRNSWHLCLLERHLQRFLSMHLAWYINKTIDCKIRIFSTRSSCQVSNKYLLSSKPPNFLPRLKFTLNAALFCKVNFSFLQYDLYMQVFFVTIIISQTHAHLFEGYWKLNYLHIGIAPR